MKVPAPHVKPIKQITPVFQMPRDQMPHAGLILKLVHNGFGSGRPGMGIKTHLSRSRCSGQKM